MSIEALNWALSTRIESSPQLPDGKKVQRGTLKAVLLVLANCANAEDWKAFPSVQYLVNSTEIDRKTIMRAIESLIVLGLLIDTGRRVGQTKQIPVYRLRPESGAESGNSPKVGTVKNHKRNSTNSSWNSTNSPGNSTNSPCEQSQSWDTEPSITITNQKAHTPRVRSECEGSPLTAEEVNRELDPLGTLPAWIDRTVLALFVRHRRQYRKPVSPGAWLQIRNELAKLHAAGHDPNQSLTYTMAAGLCIPVAAPDERTSHAAAGCSDAERTERARQEFERGQYGASRGGHVIDQDGRPV